MRRYPRERSLGDDQPVDPVAVIRSQGVGDRHADVGPVQGEPWVAERVHQSHQVAGEAGSVVPAGGFAGQPDAALVDRDDGEVPGQRRHQHPPRVPGLGPAVHQQQRRALAPGDRVQANLTGVNVPACERAGEPGWEVRRPGNRAGAIRVGRRAHDDHLSHVALPHDRAWGSHVAPVTSLAVTLGLPRSVMKRAGRHPGSEKTDACPRPVSFRMRPRPLIARTNALPAGHFPADPWCTCYPGTGKLPDREKGRPGYAVVRAALSCART